MRIKPSIENSTAFVDENRKFTFGVEVWVMNNGLVFNLESPRSFSGDPVKIVSSCVSERENLIKFC